MHRVRNLSLDSIHYVSIEYVALLATSTTIRMEIKLINFFNFESKSLRINSLEIETTAKWRQFSSIALIRCNICIVRFTRHLHGIVNFYRTTSHIQIVVFTLTTNEPKGMSKTMRRRRAFIVWIFTSIEDIMPMEKLLRSIWGRIFIFILTAFRWIYVHFVDSYFVLITLSAMKWVDDERWAMDSLRLRWCFGFHSFCALFNRISDHTAQTDVVKLRWPFYVWRIQFVWLDGSHLPKPFLFS